MTDKKPDQGLSLLDIGPLSEDVPIGTEGKTLKVFGISAEGIFAIFRRFPEVGSWFKGGQLDMPLFVGQMPEALAAVIAAGCRETGNETAEANARLLPVEAQLDILEAIVRLTFTKGFGPFVQRIVALSESAASLNYGRGAVTKSPGSSKASPQPDTASTPRGE